MIVSHEQIDSLLSKVRRPSRYLGGEVNSACRKWDEALVRWCLAFPDAYEVGMSHIGLGIIYHILNTRHDALADRCFTPWIDMEAAMREAGVPLWGLETRRPLREFDIIGITLPYELTYTNILTILNLAGIPFYASERCDDHPLIIGGGVGAFNPEPVTPFFDAILIGDGEDAVAEIMEIYRIWKQEAGGQKHELLKKLATIRGVYVPNSKLEVNKAIVADINKAPYPTKWIVPYMNVIHDRVGIEIQRGCVRGCRFCQAGFIYRPVRQKAPLEVGRLANCALASSGHEDISFLSLSAGDYEALPEILINTAGQNMWTNIGLPSLRVETLTAEILDVLKRSLHGGFTLAPEAATERMRAVINKGNTEADIIATIDKVFATGWRLLKLYFMIGLPTETLEDVEAIALLANKALDIGRKYRRDATITISISTFVPKPHTPFQWARQISIAETIERQDILKRLLRRRGLEMKWHNPRMSHLEGVFSRGDSHLAPVIAEAWKNGARFDAWDEEFKFDVWQRAFETLNIKTETYLNERFPNEPLPWDHLFIELDREFLRNEFERALAQEPTPNCMNNKCSHCGVCDFKVVRNVISSPPLKKANSPLPPFTKGGEGGITVSFTYTKTGRARWLSHLELMQVFRRTFRRACLPTAYSQGFHPHMKLSLARALKVGDASENEDGKVELVEQIDISKATDGINRHLPDGIKITALG